MKVALTRPARSWKKSASSYIRQHSLLALAIFASATFYCQTLRAADKDPIIAGQLLVATNEMRRSTLCRNGRLYRETRCRGYFGTHHQPPGDGRRPRLVTKGFGVIEK